MGNYYTLNSQSNLSLSRSLQGAFITPVFQFLYAPKMNKRKKKQARFSVKTV